MGFVRKSFRFLPVLSICFSLCFVSTGSLQAQTLPHTDTNQHEDQSSSPIAIHPTINKGQIGEQLATCAAYALIMEQVSITDLAIRDIWRDRFVTLNQDLKDHMTVHSNQTVLGKDVLFIIKSNAQWLNNHIFFPDQDGQGVVNPSQEHSVKQYVMSFCPPLYDRIDLQIAEAKGVIIPKTLLSIMENHKWDQGMIDDRNASAVTADKANLPKNNKTNIASNDTSLATASQQSQIDKNQPVKAVVIQIASYMSHEHAKRGMIHFEEAFSDITPPVILQIEEPVINNGSTYFRISTIPMIPLDAKTACNNMKKKQIGCILRPLE